MRLGMLSTSLSHCCWVTLCHSWRKNSVLAACKLLRRSWRTWTEQGAKQNEQNGGKRREGQWAWHGKGDTAGKQSPQNKAAAGEHSRRTLRPAQASKNNSQQLAGLSPCSAGWWREYDGAGHSGGGLRPTYLSPSHLSPLPVSVHTHSLNL